MPIPAGTSAQALTQQLDDMKDDTDLQPREFAEPVGVGGGVEPDHEIETQESHCPVSVKVAHPQESGGFNDTPPESGDVLKNAPHDFDGASDVPRQPGGASDVPHKSDGACYVPQNSDETTESDPYFPERTNGEDGEPSDTDMDDAMLQSMLESNVSELNPRQFVRCTNLYLRKHTLAHIYNIKCKCIICYECVCGYVFS